MLLFRKCNIKDCEWNINLKRNQEAGFLLEFFDKGNLKDLLKKNGGDIILVDTNKEGTTFKLIIPTKITHTTDKVVEYLS